ncbi:MAG: hypothetical protein ACXVEE_17635 [Polyangiales bacterium]
MLELVLLRFVWISARPEPGQWTLTYFGRCGDEPGLISGTGVTEANPPIDIDRDGLVGLGPGQSLALPLGRGQSYSVQSPSDELAPYVVVLADMRGPRPAPPIEQPAHRDAACATGATVPAVVDGQSSLVAWRASASYRDDVARLRALAAASGEGGTRAHVRRDGDRIVLSIGTRSWSWTAAEGSTPALAVVAGPHSIRVERGGGWTLHRRVVSAALFAVLLLGALHAALLVAAFGDSAAVGCLAVPAALSLLTLHPGAFGTGFLLLPVIGAWMLLGAVAALRIGWRLTRGLRTTPLRRTLVIAIHGVIVALIVGAPSRVPALVRSAIGGEPVIEPSSRPARVVLTGYSTAAGVDVFPRGADAFHELATACPSSAGVIARQALPGHTFDALGELLRREVPTPRESVVTVLFWGAGNDDIFWPLLSRRQLGGALVLDAYALEAGLRSIESASLVHPTVLQVGRALDRAADASAALAPEQEHALRDTVLAVRARGDRFVYAHDFLATDMAGGRSTSRSLLRERRRAVVTAAGGTFVDLLDELGDQVGVAWFDDFIHPSAWAHLRISVSLCRALGAAGA